jgi:hypothetical protein
MNENLTIVTGIWDLKRDSAGAGFKRPFDHYLDHFKKLLATDCQMVIFIEKENEDFVWENRDKSNTHVIHKETEEFKSNFPFFKEVSDIRQKEDWLSQAGWLKESTQATLELYNPMVMSKMFMLHDASLFNPFSTEYFAWIDGGITNTVHEGYFTHDKVFDEIHKCLERFFFISFPYRDGSEIHGFPRSAMEKYCKEDPQYVCRGGFFGGHKDFLSRANGLYYDLLQNSLQEGYMGTEESIFTIMSHLHPEVYSRYVLKDDDSALISPFFESVKNETTEIHEVEILEPENPKIALYVVAFNFPKQFEKLIKSFKQVPDFFDLTEKYVLDNSTDEAVFDEFERIARENDFTLIKKNNIGICGGRQFIAEHFDGTDSDYMLFFEDDMFLNPPSDSGFCKNGFRKYIDGLLPKSIRVMREEGFDFLKLCFTEVFGDNKTQWAWYNVPQDIREKFWPNYCELPEHGLDLNAPLVEYEHIKQIDDLTYATGEIYYANWPQIVSKEGNKKMFLNTKWARPFEQTWMSFMLQELKKGDLSAGILLASPITHDRFEHYDPKIRVES